LNRKWKVAVLILGIAIVAFFIWWFNPYHGFPSAYTKVVVPLNNSGSYTYDGTDVRTFYSFQWGFCISPINGQISNRTDVFYASSAYYVQGSIKLNPIDVKSYPVSLNSLCEMGSKSSVYGGIEIKVSEIHPDYIILLVKPL